MKLKKILPLLLALCLSGLAMPFAYGTEKVPPPEILAKSALLIDPVTEDVLYGKNVQEKLYPASVTKIMTTLLALEYGNLADSVTASETAFIGLDPGGSTQNIKPGETISLEDLLYCIMVASANEACNIVAEHIFGSVDEFVAKMNEKAAELNCSNTHFMNTHGLQDPEHYTSAWDVYLITREALKNPKFLEIANTIDHRIAPTNKTASERVFYTTNHLISRFKDPNYIYHQAKGIKTGHTSDAGYCLVSSAEKNGQFYISVVMGAPREEDGTVHSFTETKDLFEWGFDNFSVKTLCNTSDVAADVPVLEGLDHQSVVVVPSLKVEKLVTNSMDLEGLEKRITIYEPDGVLAPVKRGQELGKMELVYQGDILAEVPLVAAINVDRSEVLRVKEDVTTFFEQPWVRFTLIGLGVLLVLYTLFTILYNTSRRRKRNKDSLYSGRYRGKRGKY